MTRTIECRAAGILLHISSLPSPYGIGTLGNAAREFVDFLAAAGQTYWQVLPLGPTGYGDSPYQAFGSQAGNPYFLDLDRWLEEGLLTEEELTPVAHDPTPDTVDYARLYHERIPLMRLAFSRLSEEQKQSVSRFAKEQADWLDDYSLFMAIKDRNEGRAWSDWPAPFQRRDPAALEWARTHLAEDIAFHCFLQYSFYQQWEELKLYANRHGVRLIGDLPIYVSLDSAEVWTDPDLFYLDKHLVPTIVGGVPPDYFSEEGQLWGNPLYRWSRHKKEGYAWWLRRLGGCARFFDVLRIDHFRGFDAFWGVPFGDKTAAGGKWYKGPGLPFFKTVNRTFPALEIIAEDLGFMTESAYALRRNAGYPGMQVLEFAFAPTMDSDALPHKHSRDNVVYIGSHDNATLREWFEDADPATLAFAAAYGKLDEEEGLNWGFFRMAYASVANTVILQAQDIPFLGREARMNRPATTGGNWAWRLLPGQLTDRHAAQLAELVKRYGRDLR